MNSTANENMSTEPEWYISNLNGTDAGLYSCYYENLKSSIFLFVEGKQVGLLLCHHSLIYLHRELPKKSAQLIEKRLRYWH